MTPRRSGRAGDVSGDVYVPAIFVLTCATATNNRLAWCRKRQKPMSAPPTLESLATFRLKKDLETANAATATATPAAASAA